jgi:hypothetical protein
MIRRNGCIIIAFRRLHRVHAWRDGQRIWSVLCDLVLPLNHDQHRYDYIFLLWGEGCVFEDIGNRTWLFDADF